MYTSIFAHIYIGSKLAHDFLSASARNATGVDLLSGLCNSLRHGVAPFRLDEERIKM